MRVQFPIWHKRGVAGIRAAQQRDAQLAGLLEQAHGAVPVALDAINLAAPRPNSRPTAIPRCKNVMVGMIRAPASATTSSSVAVARSACKIQSTPASAAARVEPAPRA